MAGLSCCWPWLGWLIWLTLRDDEALSADESQDRLARDLRIMMMRCFSSSSSFSAELIFRRLSNSGRER
jgi:hypothetical protein